MNHKKALVASVASPRTRTRRVRRNDDGGGNGNGGGNFDDPRLAAGGKNPDAAGPGARDRRRQAGGEITVLAPDPDDGLASLDPAGLWSVTDNGIAQDLLFRSLTTFRQNEDGEYELVPDLATDLGTPNEDFTEWRFTLKDGIKWETGDPVTAEEVAFGIKRSLRRRHLRHRPRHVVLQAVLRRWRGLQRPLRGRRRTSRP